MPNTHRRRDATRDVASTSAVCIGLKVQQEIKYTQSQISEPFWGKSQYHWCPPLSGVFYVGLRVPCPSNSYSKLHHALNYNINPVMLLLLNRSVLQCVAYVCNTSKGLLIINKLQVIYLRNRLLYMFCSCFFLFFFCFFLFFRPPELWDNRSLERLNGFSWNFHQTIGGNVVWNVVPPLGESRAAPPPGEWRMLMLCVIYDMTLSQSPEGATGGCVIQQWADELM